MSNGVTKVKLVMLKRKIRQGYNPMLVAKAISTHNKVGRMNCQN
jgi:hypothetical protein